MIEHFKLELIDPNPWQTRGEDEEHVQMLAESIRTEGLLQVPVGRGTSGDHVQLAFGHSRLAAYRLLAAEDPKFGTFPVDVKEITDERMFELAVRENAERKDLTPIEEARAMRTYRETFKKTTKEIGVLFHLTDSAVRNKLRLLELPEAVLPMVGNEITEGTARRLVTLQKVLPAAEMTELASSIKAGEVVNPEMVEELMSDRLRAHAFELRGKWDKEPRVANDLFRFDWKIPEGWTLPDMKKKDLEALGLIGHELSEDELEKQQILAAPPACNACPYHTVINETHYCSLELCFRRKKDVFRLAEVMRVSTETGIAIYAAEKDGKVFRAVHFYGDDQKWQKFLAEKKEHLRLRPASSVQWYGRLDDAKWVEILDVSPEAVKAAEDQKKQAADQDAHSKKDQEKWEIQAQNRDRADQFVGNVAVEMFSHAFDGIENVGLLEWMVGDPSEKKTRDEKLKNLRWILANRHLWNGLDWQIRKDGPLAVAKHLAGVAKAIGLALPQDWEEKAKEFEVPAPGKETS